MNKAISLLIGLILISGVLAYPIYVKPKVDGRIQPNTIWEYTFNFSNDSGCTDILVTNTTNITTGPDGIGFFDVNISELQFVPNYLCEYRNGTLRLNKAFPDMVFQNLFANNITTEGFILIETTQQVQGNLLDIPAPDGTDAIITNNTGDTFLKSLETLNNAEVGGDTTLFGDLTIEPGGDVSQVMDATSTFIIGNIGGWDAINCDGNVETCHSDWTWDMLSVTLGSLIVNTTTIMHGSLSVNGTLDMNYRNIIEVNNITANNYKAPNGTLSMSLTEDSDDLIMSVDVGGANFFSIETTGTFFAMYGNPGAGNGDLMATISETQGADTEINFYEGGTNHNRFWNSGSGRVGGAPGSHCNVMDTRELVDCDTPSSGADWIVQHQTLSMGGFISGNDTTTNITEDGIIQFTNLSDSTVTTDTPSIAMIEDRLCYWDATRKDWLSVGEENFQFGRKLTGASSFQTVDRIILSTSRGFHVGEDITITGYGCMADNIPSRTIRFLKNSTALENWVWSNRIQSDHSMNHTVESNYFFSVTIPGGIGTLPDIPLCSVYWRFQC